MPSKLVPWMVWAGEDTEDAAWPVFARDIEEAKRIGFEGLCGIAEIDSLEEVEAAALPDTAYLRSFAKGDEPHFVDPPPPGCADCFCWGVEPLDKAGLCAECAERAEGGEL